MSIPFQGIVIFGGEVTKLVMKHESQSSNLISACYRNISMLFPASTSFIQHDCDPNILKYIIYQNKQAISAASVTSDLVATPTVMTNAEDDFDAISVDPHHDQFAIKLTSTRAIQAGDTLSINYVDIALNVIERRSQLTEAFYFYCDCLRCRVELFDELLYV